MGNLNKVSFGQKNICFHYIPLIVTLFMCEITTNNALTYMLACKNISLTITTLSIYALYYYFLGLSTTLTPAFVL